MELRSPGNAPGLRTTRSRWGARHEGNEPMAAIVLLKNKKTGAEEAVYTVDARERMKKNGDWVFVRRLNGNAKIMAPGVAVEGDSIANFVGDSKAEADAKQAQLEEAEAAEKQALLENEERLARTSADLQKKAEEDAAALAAAEEVETVSGNSSADVQAPQGQRGGGPQEPAQPAPDATAIVQE